MGILPASKTGKLEKLEDQIILLYGRAKVGKSTLASQFPKPIFLATESGLNHLEVFKVNVTSWTTFLSACSEIADGKHDFKTVVIDTAPNLVMLCSEHVCQQNGIEHPSELPMGKGWHLVTAELHRALTKLSSLPYGLVMIAHSRQEEIETKTRKYTRWTIDVSGKNKNVFLNISDVILFVDSTIDKDGSEYRIIRTKPSMNWEAGDRTGKLPAELPLDFKKLAENFK